MYNCKLIIYSDSIFDKVFFKNLNIPNKSYKFIKNLNFKINQKIYSLNLIEKEKIIDNYYANISKKNIKTLI